MHVHVPTFSENQILLFTQHHCGVQLSKLDLEENPERYKKTTTHKGPNLLSDWGGGGSMHPSKPNQLVNYFSLND